MMYKLLLGTPHKDKIAMEDLLAASSSVDSHSSGVNKQEPVCENVVVRCALFKDYPAEVKPLRAGYPKRVKGVREGVRWGDMAGPVFGSNVGREDVGRWIYEELASGKAGWNSQGVYGGEWKGKKVSLAY